MQPQVVGAHEAARRTWKALAGVNGRTDLGPAVKLAYCELWFSLGGRPGCYDLTYADLAAAFGCTHRAAQKWLARLVEVGLVDEVGHDQGRLRVYVCGPDEAGAPRRLAADPQLALPFDEEQAAEGGPLETSPATLTLHERPPERGPFGAQRSAADLLAHKGPDLLAHKGPPENDELAALQSSLVQRRQALGIVEKPPPQRLGGGPFGAQRSELRAQSSSIERSREELRALELGRFGAQRSAPPSPQPQPTPRSPPAEAAPQPSALERVLGRFTADAAEDHRRRRESLVAAILGRLPAVKPSVARNVVDGVLNGLFEWSDVERMLDAAATKEVPWAYFVGAAKQKYRDVKARWPSWGRKKSP